MSQRRKTLDECIDDYMKTDRVRQRSQKTHVSYRRSFDALRRVMGGSRPIDHMQGEHLAAAIDVLRQPATREEVEEVQKRKFGRVTRRGRSELSLNIDRSNLRGFLRFCFRRAYVTRDLSDELASAPRLRTDSAKRDPLKKGLAIELLDLAHAQHPRDRAVVAIALLAGLRESEIRALKWKHVHFDEGYIDYPRPKRGGEYHQVALNPLLDRELRFWWQEYSKRFPEMNREWYIIPARKHGGGTVSGAPSAPMHPGWPIVPNRQATQLLVTIKPLFEKLGILDLDGKGMHTLRRTFANDLYEHTGDIRVVQQALGHVYQHTTELYMDINRDRERTADAMRTWNPYTITVEQNENVVVLRRRPSQAG